MSALSPLPRQELERLPKTRLGKPSAFKPSVWRVETAGGPIVVKDAGNVGRATRWIARWIVARERKALEHLSTLDGVPQLVAAIDRDAIAMGLLPGRTIDKRIFRARPRAIFEQLLALADQMHALGLFHLDLHQRKNVLVDDEGRVRVVDFGSAVVAGPLVRFFLGRLLRFADRQAAYKYLARFAPEELTPEEARAVLRQRAARRIWMPFSPHSKRETRAARARLG